MHKEQLAESLFGVCQTEWFSCSQTNCCTGDTVKAWLHPHTYRYTSTQAHTQTDTRARKHTNRHTSTHMSTHTHTHEHTSKHTHEHAHTHTRARTSTHTHTHSVDLKSRVPTHYKHPLNIHPHTSELPTFRITKQNW